MRRLHEEISTDFKQGRRLWLRVKRMMVRCRLNELLFLELDLGDESA